MHPSIRIALAVFIGLVVTVVLSVATDVLMVVTGMFPKDGDIMMNQGLLLLASSYRAIYAIVGAFVAGLVAKEHFRRAVLVLGAVATVLGVAGIFAMRDKWHFSTAWYPISLAVLAIPYCMIGGMLYERYRSVKS